MRNSARAKVEDIDSTEEHVARQILAYLGAVRFHDGKVEDEVTMNGRRLILRLAADSDGEDYPRTKLTPAECADVLGFVRWATPVNQKKFISGTPNPACGFLAITGCLMENLRAIKASASRA